MGSRREMREWRRQADPSFPVVASSKSAKSRPSKPPPPRPSEPPPARPSDPPLSSRTSEPPPSSRPSQQPPSRSSEQLPSRISESPAPSKPGQGVLKGQKSRNRKKGKKGLRVSFDLESTQERVVPDEVKKEEVVECWEDLSDADGVGTGVPGRLEDIIDCEKQLSNIGSDFLPSDSEVECAGELMPVSEAFGVMGGDTCVGDDLEELTYFGVPDTLDSASQEDVEEDTSDVVISCSVADHHDFTTCDSSHHDDIPNIVIDLNAQTPVSLCEILTDLNPSEGITEGNLSTKIRDMSDLGGLADTSQKEELTVESHVRWADLSQNEMQTEVSQNEGLTNLNHAGQLVTMSHGEGLTDVSHTDKLTDMKDCLGLDDINHTEEKTNITNFDGFDNVTNTIGQTDVSHVEDPIDISHAELIDVNHAEKVTDLSHVELEDISHADESTDVIDTGGLTDMTQTEGPTDLSNVGLIDPSEADDLIDVSHSEDVTNMNHDDGKADLSQVEEVTKRHHEEEVSDSNSEAITSAASEGHVPGPALQCDAASGGPVLGPALQSDAASPSIVLDEETPLEGDPDDDDDEWETEPSGGSEEVSEDTWEAGEQGEAGTDGNTVMEQRDLVDTDGEDSDNIMNEDIEAVLLALIEDQDKTLPSFSLATSDADTLTPEASAEKDQDIPASPQVTIGYECRDRKSTSMYASETESEGELVPCEDKCVGTADQSDDEPLDLSTGEMALHKEEFNQNTVKSQDGELSLDKNKQVEYKPTLVVPEAEVGASSPSPEVPEIPEEGKCIGNSESGKEKEKINGKKAGKKKGKKNKRDSKIEPVVIPADIMERPKLVRGKSWKEKREKVKSKGGGLLSLSFGNEICESEVVEGTSNLLTETYTEASMLTPTRCPQGTTVFTETPCTACSSVSGEFSESDSLHVDCKCGEQRREDTGVVALVAEVRTCDEAPEPAHTTQSTSSLAPPTVTVHVTGASDEDDDQTNDAFSMTEDTNEFFIVRTQTVAAPSHVLTEFVEDTESEDDTKHSQDENSKPQDSQCFVENTYESQETPGFSLDNNKINDALIHTNGKGCQDTMNEQYDYESSFPKLLGTQQLNLIYSYDSGSGTDSHSSLESDAVEGRTHDSAGIHFLTHSSGVVDVSSESIGDGGQIYSGRGDIIYKGPCFCGDNEVTKDECISSKFGAGVSEPPGEGAEKQLCVPPLRGNTVAGVVSVDGNKRSEETTSSELKPRAMGSTQEDQSSYFNGNSKDIRLRINEIVGSRLLRDRGRASKEEGGSSEDQHGGREDSPLPGSSPASSSGVQGSDEMSLSRSRSQSPSREESASPAPPSYKVSELTSESCPEQLPAQDRYEREALESLRALRFEGSVESTPEKITPVDCSFRTFRDMYQINPIYLTDSDDHEEQNESDTVVPVSVSLDYDPERSITVTSWSSTSDFSPDPSELRPSPPLPGTHVTKKVPKVTRLLRETQGIVQRWEVLQAQAVERQRQSSQVRELQRQVKTLRLALEALNNRAIELTKADDTDTRIKLIQKMQEAKALQQEVSSRKVEVSSINLAVHRFLTETGYSLAAIKDDVADLYRLWDEADRRVSSEVSRLENVDATWKLWESQAEELAKMLRQDGDTLKVLDAAIQTGSMTDSTTASMQLQGVARLLNDKRKTQPGKKLLLQHTKTQSIDILGSSHSLATSGDECLSDSGTSGYESCSSEELSERERRLANLRRLARDLEASLHPNSQAWAAICKTLSSAETELKDLQQHCRELVVRSSETLDQAKTSPQLRRRMWSKDSKVGKTSRRANNTGVSGRGGGRRGWVWRVMKAALPFQAALLLLFCVACLLEPNCCDHVNTLNLSLSPQLRYVNGLPPV